jgi:beta-lactamase regulating signal transducer with metallopeptidase domain
MIPAFLSALLNGAILSVPVAAAVWLLFRLATRRALNATTRYAVWWATLVLIFCVSAPRFHRAARLPLSATGPAATVEASSSLAPIVAPDHAPLGVNLIVAQGPWTRWIVTGWLALSLLLLIRLIASYRSLHRCRTRAVEAPVELRTRAKDWLALRPGARLAVSNDISTPMAVGPWQPAILIPAQLLDELEAEELDQIILHEAAHLARRDDAGLLLQRVVEALLPLHPVVRWITRQLDLEREIACDDFVVETLRSPRAYAKCLTRVLQLSGHVRESVAAATAVDNLSHFARRVNMLLDRTRSTGTRLRKARLGAIVGVLALLGWIGASMPGVVSIALAQEMAQITVPQPAPRERPLQPVQTPAAPKPQPSKPAASSVAPPVAPARPLDPGQDPEGKVLSYRFGWELSYLHFVKNVDLDEDPDVQAFGEVYKKLLNVYKGFDGTAAAQDAAIQSQLAVVRAMVDKLTEARLADERPR